MRQKPYEFNYDLIDVRSVIGRVEHLRQLRQPGPVDLGPADSEVDQDMLFAELSSLEALLSSAVAFGGEMWEGNGYPGTLIRDGYLSEHAKTLAEETGVISSRAKWPCTHIDWDQAALQLTWEALTSVAFANNTYWIL